MPETVSPQVQKLIAAPPPELECAAEDGGGVEAHLGGEASSFKVRKSFDVVPGTGSASPRRIARRLRID